MEVINIRYGNFTFDGIESSEFEVLIQHRPEIASAERVMELRERPGNDAIIVDFNYYRNVPLALTCYYKAINKEMISHTKDQIVEWFDTGRYCPLILYTDEQYQYEAVVTTPPKFYGTRFTGRSVPFDLELSLRPFKFDLFGFKTIEVKNNDTLINLKRYASKPLIKIYGEGAISLFINDDEFKMVGVQQTIEIDSLHQEVYRYSGDLLINQNKNYKTPDLPQLYPEENRIRWTGSVTKIEIIPRWWTKI